MAVLDVAVTKLVHEWRNAQWHKVVDFQAAVTFELDGRGLRAWAGPEGLELYD